MIIVTLLGCKPFYKDKLSDIFSTFAKPKGLLLYNGSDLEQAIYLRFDSLSDFVTLTVGRDGLSAFF